MELSTTHLLIIVLAPLLGAVVAGLFGRQVGRAGAHTVTILGVAVSCALSGWVLWQLVGQGAAPYNQNVYTLFEVGSYAAHVGFMVDRLTAMMMVVVTFVSLLVHVYTIGYMKDDPGYQRFFSYISLFTFSMLMLVMSNNFLQLFFGWEAVGLVSYLLIGFWFKKPTAVFANMKAFLVNRVGDFGFLLGIAAVVYWFGTLDYATVFANAGSTIGDGQVVEINPQTTNDRYNQKAYTPPNNPGGQGNSGTNIRRIRYSHVLLNAAEACARSGDEASALLWLNDVRARAREHDVTLGFTPELLDEDIAFDVLGLPGDATRVFVRYVHPESWAAGQLRSFASSRVEYDGGLVPVCIEQMDLIQSVNGTPITTLDDYFNAVSSLSPGQQADVELLRVSQQPCGTAGSADVQEVSVTIEARQLLPPITASGQALLEAIWHERRVELALEQHRWFDLIRQGRAAEVMAGVGKVFQVGTHELYPIPQGEVDVAGLQQNPGY